MLYRGVNGLSGPRRRATYPKARAEFRASPVTTVPPNESRRIREISFFTFFKGTCTYVKLYETVCTKLYETGDLHSFGPFLCGQPVIPVCTHLPPQSNSKVHFKNPLCGLEELTPTSQAPLLVVPFRQFLSFRQFL